MSTLDLPNGETNIWTQLPHLWFVQMETYFSQYNVTSEHNKANVAISFLNGQVDILIQDLISNPDPISPYTSLKNRLIEIFSVKNENVLRRALNARLTKNEKPSEILAIILELNHQLSYQTVKSIFLDYLPKQCQKFLSETRCNELHELGKLADEVVKAIDPLNDDSVRHANLQIKKNMQHIEFINLYNDWLKSKIDVLEEDAKNFSIHEYNRQSRNHNRNDSKAVQKRSFSNFRLKSRNNSSNKRRRRLSLDNSSSDENNNVREKIPSPSPKKCDCEKPCTSHGEHIFKVFKIAEDRYDESNGLSGYQHDTRFFWSD